MKDDAPRDQRENDPTFGYAAKLFDVPLKFARNSRTSRRGHDGVLLLGDLDQGANGLLERFAVRDALGTQ